MSAPLAFLSPTGTAQVDRADGAGGASTSGQLADGADAADGASTSDLLADGVDAAGGAAIGGLLAGGSDAAGGTSIRGPVARSPLADAAAAAGAILAVRDGWEVPESFGDLELERQVCRETVGFADRSALGKLDLHGSVEGLSELRDAVSPGVVPVDAETDGAGPVDSAPVDVGGFGVAVRCGDGWWCPVAPGHALVLCEPAATAGLLSRLQGTGVGHCLDVTAAFGALAFVGPAVREVFARFCALDLRDRVVPVGGFRPGSVARTPGFVLREGEDRWLVVFGAAYAGYVWETVSDAASRLGGRPVGQWVFDA